MTQNVLIVDDTEINLILFSALVKKLDVCVAHTFMGALQGLQWATPGFALRCHLPLLRLCFPWWAWRAVAST